MAAAPAPRLDPAEADTLIRRLAGRPAVLPVADLPLVLGMPVEAAGEALDELQALGLAEVWESPLGPSVTLTALAADRLGLDLVAGEETGSRTLAATLRWVPRGQSPPERSRLPLYDDLVAAEALEADLEIGLSAVPDPRPIDPGDRSRDAIHVRLVNHPGTILIGFGTVGWRPAIESATPCAVCGGRPLARNEICLGCAGAGVADILASRRTQPDDAEPLPSRPADDGLSGGLGPASPRAKATSGLKARKWPSRSSRSRTRAPSWPSPSGS